jgi:hypothetical protein
MATTDSLDGYARYALIYGEDTYTSPTAQSPDTARRVLGLIPSPSGELEREQRHPTFLAAALTGGRVGYLEEFNWFNSATKVFTKFFLAATASKLYKQKVGTDSNWSELTTYFSGRSLALADFPVSVSIDNLLHLSDGAKALIYDGVQLLEDGLPAGTIAPAISTTAGSGTPALVSSTRYYWQAFVDETTAVTSDHEGSASPRSVGSGVVNASGNVSVKQQPGTVSTSTASAAVTGVSTQFTKLAVGWALYTAGQLQGYILSIASDTSLTLVANAATTTSGVSFTGLPARATHWYLYASESESSNQGVLRSAVAASTVSFSDTSAFPNVAGSTYANSAILMPLRNDQPLATKVMEVHKTRIFRRRETQPNFFNYTGAEEIENGSPAECAPGVGAATVSDLVNETSYPDESDSIRAMRSHGDALYIATEDDAVPVFGESRDDFTLSQIVAFKVGAAGRRAMVSTKWGLVFGANDRKLYLYPSFAPAAAATSSLIELGRPKRTTFELIKASDIDNWNLVHYVWGRRDWLVVCYQDRDSVFHTYVLDFEMKSWFELATGFAAAAVFEVADGNKVLVGGGTDGFVYVLDDLTGTYAGAGNFPAGIYRTPLLDFGQPAKDHIIYAVEYEKSDDALAVEVRVYLDPANPDAPTNGIVVNMVKTRLGWNRYRGFIQGSTGGTCHRAMVEISVPASTVDAKLRSLAVYANPIAQFGVK